MDDHWHRMAAAFEALQQKLGRHWGPLSRPQRRILTQLRQSAWSVSDLAAQLDISPAGVTQMVDKLASRGFVQRTRSDDDQRMVHIGLTPAGQDALAQADAIFQNRLQSLALCLSRADQMELLRLLEAMADITASPSPTAAK